MADQDEMDKDRYFFEATDNAIRFFERLESDSVLRDACRKTDLQGRMEMAYDEGYRFSESHMRVAVRIWDYHGTWREWLSPGSICEEVDALPPLDEPYLLDDQFVKSFQENGHVLLRGVLSDSEIRAFRPVIRSVLDKAKSRDRILSGDRELFSDIGFVSLINLRAQDARARCFVYARRFGKLAADLMNVDRVRVYLDETFEKFPGFKKTHWHQDRLYFPLETNNLVTMWMPMVDTSVEMGTLSMVSRSHFHGDYGYRPIKEDSDLFYERAIEEQKLAVEQMPAMKAGDATFHNGWLLHGAPPNRTDRVREVMSVVFYPDGTRLCEPTNEYQRRAIQFGFRKRPGEVASSPLHPVVYDRHANREAEAGAGISVASC